MVVHIYLLDNGVYTNRANFFHVELEASLLKLGANPMYQGFNGASEFRALNDIELREAVDLISKYRINLD